MGSVAYTAWLSLFRSSTQEPPTTRTVERFCLLCSCHVNECAPTSNCKVVNVPRSIRPPGDTPSLSQFTLIHSFQSSPDGIEVIHHVEIVFVTDLFMNTEAIISLGGGYMSAYYAGPASL